MSIPHLMVIICFLILMAVGVFVLVFSLLRLTKKDAPSKVSLPGFKVELSGPAWLIVAIIGATMAASPVIAAAMQRPDNVTIAPRAVEGVRRVLEPSYEAFRFTRDVSILDLRASTTAPWYTYIPGLGSKKQRTRPGVLKNYMLVRKVSDASEIHLTYGTSGKLDVRCLTHQAKYQKAETLVNGKTVETWDVIADISAVPKGTEFEIAVEATYWNGFTGDSGDDYTTYAHNQSEAEQMSVLVLFPDDRPFRSVDVSEFGPDAKQSSPLQAPSVTVPGPEKQTYYWSTTNQRPNWYYKVSWLW